MRKREIGNSQTITEIYPQRDKERINNRLSFKHVGQPKDKFLQQDAIIDLNKIENFKNSSYKNIGETKKNNLKEVIDKITQFGYRGRDALLLHPFSPHPLGQDSSLENAHQLTQSDDETKLINHSLAFQFQDGLEKAASFHFADSEAFQKARDLALGSIAEIDNVHHKVKYMLEALDSRDTLDTLNSRIERTQQCLEAIKELKTCTNMTSDSQTLKLRVSKLKIKEYVDNSNKHTEEIKSELRRIRETKQFVETLLEQGGASKSLDPLKSNIEKYEDVLKSAIALEEKFSENIKNVFNTKKSYEIVNFLEKLEPDAKNLIEAENKAKNALYVLKGNYTNKHKIDVMQPFKQYIDSLRKKTRNNLAKSLEQIEKIEQGFKEAVQKEEKAATAAHLIVDRVEGGRISINGTWVHMSEIYSLDYSKEGQTKVNWRPDIPEIIMTSRDPESGKNKSEKLVNDKFLQDLYAKRQAKVEKLTGWGKCTFEIPDNTFNQFTAFSDGLDAKHIGRSKAILTLECQRDPLGKALEQDYQEMINIEKKQIEPEIDSEGSKVLKNRRGEDINVGILKKMYKFTSNDGKDIMVTIKEETSLLKRPRNNDSEEIMTKTITQTQECTSIQDGKSKKNISTRKSTFTQTVDKNNIISKEDKNIYTQYENSEGQVIKSIYEVPAVSLQKIAIDAATKNVKMLAEPMVMIATKTLPDSPIIYHSEVKPNPEINLRQMDRINLIDKKLHLRNDRKLDLAEIDWLKTWDERNGKADSDVVFRTVGPKKTYLVSLKHAGSDLLFTQQDKAKENELIATVEENQTKLLQHLKQSIQLAADNMDSDTFNAEILQNSFKTAEICDNEITRQILLNKEMIMDPPENRNDLAQLMRSREEASQGDAAMLKTVDGNSGHTRNMTEVAKIFRRQLIDTMTNKGREGELLTQIVADQQGLDKLVAYDVYNHKLSLIDNKTLDLLDAGRKHFNLTNMANVAEIREKVKEKIDALTTDRNENSEAIEKGNKFIDDVNAHADQIEETIHFISNMKKLEDEIDNSSDLYAKNWLNLKRAKAAADHNKFKNIEEEKVSTSISKDARHNKNWLIIRNAIENKGIKGVYSYIENLKVPTLSNTRSPKDTRKVFEQLWVNYLTNVERQAQGNYASIKVALCKAEYLRQYIDKHEKNAQDMISQGVPLAERRRSMLNALPEIDESFLLTPARPKVSEDSLTSAQFQQDTNDMFNANTVRNKSSEQLSKEARDRATLDLKEAMKAVEKLINFETHDPILKIQLRKDAKDLIKILADNARDYRVLDTKFQHWLQKLPEMKKLQWMQFWMTLWAPLLNPQSTINTLGDGLNKVNTKFVNSIVG